MKLAIFDDDLVCRKVGKFEVTDGNQIRVKSKGGKGHFMPHFDINSGLQIPYRALSSPWKISYAPLYIVQSKAKHCVNFKPAAIICPKCSKEIQPAPINKGPDPSLVIDTANKIMLEKIGDQKKETPLIDYVIVVLLLMILAVLMGVVKV